MARTTTDIFNSMVAEGVRIATLQNNADALAMFANTSKVAIWRLLFYVMAFAVMSFEKLLDAHIVAVDEKLLLQKTLRSPWYREKALGFQFGFALNANYDFDNTGKTDSEIAASKIIKYAAVTEAVQDDLRVLQIKIATLTGTDLVPITTIQLAAIVAYFDRVKGDGVTIKFYNQVADLLRTVVEVYYDPLLLDGNGLRTDAAGYPVKEAAILYPTILDFNGEFTNAGFIDALQNCYGVSRRKVNLIKLERKTGNGTWQSVGSSFIPDAGYCKFDTDGLTINYIADV